MGYLLTKKGVCFGGNTLTTTDIAVAAGLLRGVDAGDKLSSIVSKNRVDKTLNGIRRMVENGIDQMKVQ